jgi:hypothetical protein
MEAQRVNPLYVSAQEEPRMCLCCLCQLSTESSQSSRLPLIESLGTGRHSNSRSVAIALEPDMPGRKEGGGDGKSALFQN